MFKYMQWFWICTWYSPSTCSSAKLCPSDKYYNPKILNCTGMYIDTFEISAIPMYKSVKQINHSLNKIHMYLYN